MTEPPFARRWQTMRSLLAVRLDGLGDLLMTTPALRALKEHRPGRRLTLLTSPAGAALARELPFVDETIAFAAPWMKHGAPADGEATAALVERLKAGRHDGAAIFTVCTQSPLPSALVCYLAGIPRRLAHVRENPYELVNDAVRDPDVDVRQGVRHEVERQLALVAATGATIDDPALVFPVAQAARASMLAKATAAGVDRSRPWLLVHPGATAPSRRYPLAAFGEALRRLDRGTSDARQVVIAGGPDDVADAAALAAQVRGAVSVAGLLTLPELAALVERAALLLCNNSGPAHIAAAVGTPVVDLYALTNPQHTPWRVAHATLSHDVPCRGCLRSVCPEGHHLCLAGVAPAEVAAAVERLYAPLRAGARVHEGATP
jgi:lipopolysaccharide heptosyltransferase II